MGEEIGNRHSGTLTGNISICELPECTNRRALLDDTKSADRPNLYVFPESAATGLAFTSDSAQIIAAVLGVSAYTDPEIRFHEYESYPRLVFHDARTLRSRRVRVAGGSAFGALAVSPDGHIVATGHDEHTVRLWRGATGRQLRYFQSRSDWSVRQPAVCEASRSIRLATGWLLREMTQR